MSRPSRRGCRWPRRRRSNSSAAGNVPRWAPDGGKQPYRGQLEEREGRPRGWSEHRESGTVEVHCTLQPPRTRIERQSGEPTACDTGCLLAPRHRPRVHSALARCARLRSKLRVRPKREYEGQHGTRDGHGLRGRHRQRRAGSHDESPKAGFRHIQWIHHWRHDFIYTEPEIRHIEQLLTRSGALALRHPRPRRRREELVLDRRVPAARRRRDHQEPRRDVQDARRLGDRGAHAADELGATASALEPAPEVA